MKTFTLNSEQTISTNAFIPLTFLEVDEVVFTTKARADRVNDSSYGVYGRRYVLGKENDLIYSITFDYPVKNFELNYRLEDSLLLFKSNSYVTKVTFDPPLPVSAFYYGSWFKFDHAPEVFSLKSVDLAGGLPDQLMPSPTLKCSVLSEELRKKFQENYIARFEVTEVASISSETKVSSHQAVFPYD